GEVEDPARAGRSGWRSWSAGCLGHGGGGAGRRSGGDAFVGHGGPGFTGAFGREGGSPAGLPPGALASRPPDARPAWRTSSGLPIRLRPGTTPPSGQNRLSWELGLLSPRTKYCSGPKRTALPRTPFSPSEGPGETW